MYVVNGTMAGAPPTAFGLIGKIASGGMATVYLARPWQGGREDRWAVKVLHPHLAEDPHVRRMFLHEAELAERLSHPHVVRVLSHGEHPDFPAFIAMEYIEGGDLADLLRAAKKRGQLLPPGVVLRLALDLLAGLQAAHELVDDEGELLHLIHRDVSPHNVLVGVDGMARLADFGIARSDQRYTSTRSGQARLKGKLSYMAPEQMEKERLDQRVDIFAVGVVVWELLLCRRLFKAEDELGTIKRVLSAEVRPPSAYAPALAPFDQVLMTALSRDREARFASAAAMAEALVQMAPTVGGVASRATTAAFVADLLRERVERRAWAIRGSAPRPSVLTGSLGSECASFSGSTALPDGQGYAADAGRSASIGGHRALDAPKHGVRRWRGPAAFVALSLGAAGGLLAVYQSPRGGLERAARPVGLQVAEPDNGSEGVVPPLGASALEAAVAGGSAAGDGAAEDGVIGDRVAGDRAAGDRAAEARPKPAADRERPSALRRRREVRPAPRRPTRAESAARPADKGAAAQTAAAQTPDAPVWEATDEMLDNPYLD